ncbi:MAG TPA: glycosyltransferase [Pirellulales bacterium]|nr:glycosyltransferase [Pirellulales bacterium]
MHLAYLVPNHQYLFFRELIPHLEAAGIGVSVNGRIESADLVLAAMLPQTPEWVEPLRRLRRPTILWHWDQFSFVDYQHHPGWRGLFELMAEPFVVDRWCASYEVCRQLRASHGYDSWMVGSWVNPADFGGPPQAPGDYVLYAATPAAFHKRHDWARLACERLGIPFRSTYQRDHSRRDYCRLMTGCRVYVMAGFEESNATIPALEAAVCGKPVVAADLPAVREELGDTAAYFDVWNFGDLLEKLSAAWQGPDPLCDARRERVLRMFSVEVVAEKIARRLRELLALSTRVGEGKTLS